MVSDAAIFTSVGNEHSLYFPLESSIIKTIKDAFSDGRNLHGKLSESGEIFHSAVVSALKFMSTKAN